MFQEKNVSNGRARQEEMKSVYTMMVADPSAPYELISAEWLSAWIKAEKADKVPVIDNSKLLCNHFK